jgi:rod shape-determining protein MreC
MEGFLNRYRNITVLLLVLFGQLVLLAVQVKNDQDVRIIRVWTVTAVTPVARALEGVRGGGLGFIRNYIMLRRADEENRQLREENGRLRVENISLKNELARADRAKALQLFQERTPSKMIAATVIATGAGPNSKLVFVDRGTVSGVMRGMGVVTPDGIVGKVTNAYPTTSEVLLITDAEFAAGVVSQMNQARGTLKGDGTPLCRVDYVPPEQKVEVGEMFYTSGDDRVFPRGFPVGVVKAVRGGTPFKDIVVEPSGVQRGLEDVLIVVQGTHQEVPEAQATSQPVYIAPPPPDAASKPATSPTAGTPQAIGTEADKLRNIYKAVGEQQNHNFGEGAPGSKPPDFTKLPNQVPAAGVPSATGVDSPRPPAPGPRPPVSQPPTPNPQPPSKAQPPKTGGPARQ